MYFFSHILSSLSSPKRLAHWPWQYLGMCTDPSSETWLGRCQSVSKLHFISRAILQCMVLFRLVAAKVIPTQRVLQVRYNKSLLFRPQPYSDWMLNDFIWILWPEIITCLVNCRIISNTKLHVYKLGRVCVIYRLYSLRLSCAWSKCVGYHNITIQNTLSCTIVFQYCTQLSTKVVVTIESADYKI